MDAGRSPCPRRRAGAAAPLPARAAGPTSGRGGRQYRARTDARLESGRDDRAVSVDPLAHAVRIADHRRDVARGTGGSRLLRRLSARTHGGAGRTSLRGREAQCQQPAAGRSRSGDPDRRRRRGSRASARAPRTARQDRVRDLPDHLSRAGRGHVPGSGRSRNAGHAGEAPDRCVASPQPESARGRSRRCRRDPGADRRPGGTHPTRVDRRRRSSGPCADPAGPHRSVRNPTLLGAGAPELRGHGHAALAAVRRGSWGPPP